MRPCHTKAPRHRRIRSALFCVLFGIGALVGACDTDWITSQHRSGGRLGATPYPRPETAVDVTGRYEEFVIDGRLNPERVDQAFDAVSERLAGVRVVIVPSYLVDLLAAGRKLGLIDYFSDQRRWLESIGVETVIAPVDTEAAVADNGRLLADLIAGSDKPLCLLSHSKGGLDTLGALISLTPTQLAKVRCWISLQAPFAGSPIADLAANPSLGRLFLGFALTLLGGSPQSLDDLTTAVRWDYLKDVDAAIHRVAAAVPVLAVVTVLHEPTGNIRESPFEWPRRLMQEHGIESDGVVPTTSQILPHARFVVLENLDHGDTIDADCAPGCAHDDDITLLKALFALTLGEQR